MDEDLRSLERAVLDGDESAGPRLERIYERTGAGEELEERLLAHVGPSRPCDICPGSSGRASTGAECPSCDGRGSVGPVRFARTLLRASYLNLLGPSPRRAHIDPVALPDRCRPLTPAGRDGVRCYVLVARREALLVASAPFDDWTGSGLLARWWARFVDSGEAAPTPAAEKELRRLGAGAIEPGPLVAWWTGASVRARREAAENAKAYELLLAERTGGP